MALDGAFLFCTLNEIKSLIGAHVDKIYQPSKEEIILSFRSFGQTKKLLLSANAISARVCLTSESPENPKTPPMFCMLLRKHLNGKLIAVRQDGLERIVYLDFECVNEMGDKVVLTLTVEIMGKRSNVIFVNENGKIIDCIKRVSAENMNSRFLLPGAVYIPPAKQDKLNFLIATDDEIVNKISSDNKKELSKAVLDNIEGVSPLLSRECAFYVGRGEDVYNDNLSDEQITRLLFFFHSAKDSLNNASTFYALYDSQNMPYDFSVVPIYQYGSTFTKREFNSANELLDCFFAEKSAKQRMKQKSSDLLKIVLNALQRVSKRTEKQKAEFIKSQNREEYKIYGDLLNANLYRLKKGESEITLENFYDSNAPVTIKLKPTLSPSENAQRYYTLYRKSKTAEKLLSEQIALGEQEIYYIESVFDSLTRATTTAELSEIKEELESEGYIKKSVKQKQKDKPLPPITFLSSDGFTILAGRNNLQNDKLTLKLSSKTDIWLHTHGIHGAHVIICTEHKDVPTSTITEAANIAAYCSKARESSQVPVDYTFVKFVKKPSGVKAGMVTFTNNKTVYVTPSKELFEKLQTETK